MKQKLIKSILFSAVGTLFIAGAVGVPLIAATTKAPVKKTTAVANPPKPAALQPTEEERFVALVDRSMNSVVNIVGRRADNDDEVIGSGTGFFIDPNGLIVTNRHVVSDKKASYRVYLADGQRYTATPVALDPLYDLAFLKIDAQGFPALSLGDSDAIRIGQTTVAIGNSAGRYSNSVTRGIVSGLGRTLTASDNQGKSSNLEDVIQTDAGINLGNSGGPLLNSKGEVIGINTAIDQTGRSLGFAIPSNDVKTSLALYKKNSRIVRSFIGVRYMTIGADLQDQYQLPYNYGAYIKGNPDSTDPVVVPGGPAEKAGIRANDIVLSVNGNLLRGRATLLKAIQAIAPGSTAVFSIYRNGTIISLPITIGELPGIAP